MSALRTPIRDSLRRPIDQVAEQRIWVGIRAARSGRKPTVRRPYALAAAAIALLAALFLVTFRREGPLTLDVDRVVVEVDPDAVTKTLRASDGSSIDLAPASRLEVLENSGEVFTTLLSRGRAAFDVVPRGRRRWTVDCGGVTVEVVGTAFTIERDAQLTRVSVARGEVVVRGERVPDRRARLVAGETIEIRASDEPPGALPPSTSALPTLQPRDISPTPAPSAQAIASAPVPVPVPASSASRGADRDMPWRDRARAGDYREAYEALGQGGVARETAKASVEELFALADVARLSGHAAEAVAPLNRIVSEHGGDRRASMAALTLGRLYLDSLGQPAAAIAPLNRAIAAGLPAGLAEDALARRVDAYAQSGNVEAARASLEELERRFPSSSRAAAARQSLESK